MPCGIPDSSLTEPCRRQSYRRDQLFKADRDNQVRASRMEDAHRGPNRPSLAIRHKHPCIPFHIHGIGALDIHILCRKLRKDIIGVHIHHLAIFYDNRVDPFGGVIGPKLSPRNPAGRKPEFINLSSEYLLCHKGGGGPPDDDDAPLSERRLHLRHLFHGLSNQSLGFCRGQDDDSPFYWLAAFVKHISSQKGLINLLSQGWPGT